MPCRIRTCRGSWTYTKAQQLADEKQGRKVPRRLCAPCYERYEELQDREILCRNEGCGGTWTLGRFEQLILSQRGREIPERMCPACDAFLRAHPPVELPCGSCAAPIPWSGQAQLMTELGLWVKPELCADCKTRQVRGD